VNLQLELHAHTFASPDCLLKPADIVRACAERGIHRLAVTDHNTIRGALAVREIAPELVIVGEEIMTTQGELLAYFVQEEVPPHLTPAETVARLRAQGAVISVSHPFDRLREGAWDEADLLALLHLVDAIEVFNARCLFPEDNARALAFAQRHNLPGSVGSDAHSLRELGRARLIVERADTPADLLEGLRRGARVTRLSSPAIHLTSSFAKFWKKARRHVVHPT
jgi:predicted metal-dependent phosphoesterase TrpH